MVGGAAGPALACARPRTRHARRPAQRAASHQQLTPRSARPRAAALRPAALKDQHQAYRMACAKPGPRGPNQRVWTCDVCSRRSNSTRIEYEQPTFGAVRRRAALCRSSRSRCPSRLRLPSQPCAPSRAGPGNPPCYLPRAPTAQLVRGFCESTTLQAPPVDGRDPVSGRGCFTDEVWLAEWRRYHRVNAGQLRLTCMRCIKARQAAQQAKREAAAAATSSLEALLLQMAAAARGKAS